MIKLELRKSITILVFLGLVNVSIGQDSSSIKKQSKEPKTPPMGWNSWNHFKKGISDSIIREVIDGAQKYQLNEFGYKYLVLDDGWQEKKLGKQGELIPFEKKFPNGIKPLVKYANNRGFELGIYSSPNIYTCGNRAGSLGNEKLHAKQFVEWGCKFVKYDYCPVRNGEDDLKSSNIIERYRVFGKALHQLDSDVVYAICEKGWTGGFSNRQQKKRKVRKTVTAEERRKAFSWCSDVGGVMWRTTGDIGPKWNRIMQIVDAQEGLSDLSGPNSFNDPDMLEVGNGELTLEENRAHFSLWCMLNAPLFLGNDLRNISDEVLKIITNKELIALNQDKSCKQAKKVFDKNEIEVFVKVLSDGDYGVCILNRNKMAKEFKLMREQIGLDVSESFSIYDLWNHKAIGSLGSDITMEIPAHGVKVYRLKLKK